MIGDAFDDPRFAGAADALGAGVVRVIPASSSASRMVLPGCTAIVRLLRASFTSKPPSTAGFSLALKYSTCTWSGGRSAAAASNASSIGTGPQQ